MRLGRGSWPLLRFAHKELGVAQMQLVEPELPNYRQGAEAIDEASLEVDAAGFGKVADGHGDVTQPEAKMHGLDEELRVEHEIIGVGFKWNTLEHFPPIYPETAMEITEVLAQGTVFQRCQEPIADV